MDLNHKNHELEASSPPRQEWHAPEVKEFDILQTTQAGAIGGPDSGILS